MSKQREESNKTVEEKLSETPISEEEHKKRMEMLRGLGILRD
jgi:hypothetical protein